MEYSNLWLCGNQNQVYFLLIKKKTSNECRAGVTTFDIGQHIAGWCRLKFRGPSGFGTYIRYGEAIVQPVVSTQ